MIKKIYFAFAVLAGLTSQAQVFDAENINELKKQGKLNGTERITNPDATTTFKISKTPKNKTASASTACNCWIPQDSSFSIVPFDGSGGSGGPGQAPNYENDDWSTSPVQLPFNFCLYGTTYTSVYINNNGNVSFGGAYSTFSAVAFPSNQYVMIAPFWGDVDTRGTNSRYVHYKLTNTALIVQWDSVGYYAQHDDKRNTFQLIITDGTDPILTSGNNISFCYGDMQWTTGDASSGVNGFGGVPATVGINKGDGTHFIQISLFDHAGNNYTNSAGSPASGVDWLDYQSFQFNCCGTGTNLPPIAQGASSCADTIKICDQGDSLVYTTNFTGPENGQIVTCTANGGTLGSNFSIYNVNNGTNASLTFVVSTGGLAVGTYSMTVTGTDNGTPALSTTVTYIIHVVGNPIPNPTVTVAPNPACLSQNPTASLANCNSYDTYVWSNGSTSCSIPITTSDTMYLTVTKNGCSKSTFANIHVSPNPVVSIGGVLSYCPPTAGTTIFVNPITQGTAPYSYGWDGGTSTNDTLFNATSGTHSVVVTDANGCQGTASVTVTSNAPTLSISAAGNLCTGNVTLSPSITNGTSYVWQPGGATTQTLSVNTGGTYTLNVVVNSCTVPATYNLANPVLPSITVSGDTVLCIGDTSTLTANATPAGSYSFSWFNNATNIGNAQTQNVSAGGTTYSVVAVNNNTQCSATLGFFVNMYSLPSVTISGNPTVCQGKNDMLTATPSGGNPGYTYAWHPGTVTTQTLNATTADVFSVTVTDAKGCKAQGSMIVKISNPKITVSKNNFICPGKKASIHASGSGTAPLSYFWYPSGSTSQTFTTTVAGAYPLVMTDLYGCKDSVIVNVIYNPVPNANITYSPSSPFDPGVPVYFHDASTVNPGTIVGDTWTFGDTATAVNNFDPTHAYANGGHYAVTLFVRSDKGCLDTTVIYVDVNYPIILPNIITPNGDGINEYLEFKNLLHYTNNKLWIYNRWGKLLYSSDDYQNNWTGKDYNDGTYYFILEVPDIKKTFKGFFMSLK